MSYKTFTVRSLSSGWSNDTGNHVTLYGKIYNTTAKTIKVKEFLVLGTGDSCRMTQFPEYMYIQTDSNTLDRISTEFKNKHDYEHFEVCLEGTGTRNLRVAYFNSHAI
jgi:hypothetical protein